MVQQADALNAAHDSAFLVRRVSQSRFERIDEQLACKVSRLWCLGEEQYSRFKARRRHRAGKALVHLRSIIHQWPPQAVKVLALWSNKPETFVRFLAQSVCLMSAESGQYSLCSRHVDCSLIAFFRFLVNQCQPTTSLSSRTQK